MHLLPAKLEDKMKKLIALIPAAAILIAAVAGCTPPANDEEEILKLLDRSYFTGEGSDGVTDDGTSNVNASPGILAAAADDAPQAWVRHITYATRYSEVIIEGDSAFATISRYLSGTIYIDTIPGNGQIDTITRPIADSVYREVVLKKGGGNLFNGWYIYKITPVKLWTFAAEHPVQIEKVEVTSTSGVDFTFQAGKFYGRDDLPRFTPADEVTVTVYASTLAEGDSSWCYLHHGRHFRKTEGFHRKPFTSEDAWTHTGTWSISEDNVTNTPTVRHAAMDLLYWETLSNDPGAEYSSYALGMPYLVAEEGEELPDDGDESND